MTDITSENGRARRSQPASDPRGDAPSALGPEHEGLISFAELLYFAYRNFTSDPDAVLETYGFGRAHHRVLHFIHRNPGLKVAELLDILRITKQSLARVLKDLRDKGFVAHKPGPDDLRERRLYVTAKGTRLAEKLSVLQVRRIEAALTEAGLGADAATRRFLMGMIEKDERAQVAGIVRLRGTADGVEDQGGQA
jgi:DNA-binding MarR family transcriptional regulator